ncbi:hypothetical protein Y032_0015g2731 [Ancylostoma ceylanicum]|uniref:Uncharacterized protein n=1 Tax=Ancylostoma ceylanicum TaxID=53326 RepID=A0A016VA53_9BILA|nr:hypothetical protein Y032_0015g2731 [Ancylostoma ceylanicum]
MSAESDSSRCADSNDVIEIRKKWLKTLLSRQNVILTWKSFPVRKQRGSDEKLRLFIGMNFSTAATIDRTSISVLGNNAVFSVRFHCGMKPLVQPAEIFGILGQRTPYFSGFSMSSRDLKYICVLSSPSMFK